MSETKEDRINMFNHEYSKLDSDTQAKLDHFIAGIEEVGQDTVGATIFNGSVQLLESFMPSLQVISPTIACLKIDLHNGNYCHELKWKPNDFIIPADVLARAYARIEVSAAAASDSHHLKIDANYSSESDDENLLCRQQSSQSYYGCDDCPSSM